MPAYVSNQSQYSMRKTDAVAANSPATPFHHFLIAIVAALVLGLAAAQATAGAASTSADEPGSNIESAEPGSEVEATDAAPQTTAKSAFQPASVSVDFSVPQGKLLRTERINTWDNGDPVPDLRADDVAFLNEQGLHADLVRVGFGFDGLCDVMDTGAGCHGEGGGDPMCDVTTNTCDFSSLAGWLGDISDATDALVVHLTPRGFIQQKRPPADTQALLTLTIRELKRQFPKINYIEALNEPDWVFHGAQIYRRKDPVLQPNEVYAYYVPFYRAVNEVNAELPQGQRIKVGGPAFTGMTESWMTAFLDGYAADENPEKRLDFISYHGYGEFSDDFKQYIPYKSDPSEVSTQRARLDEWLKERKLTAGLPALITETGIYPGPSFDEPDPSKNDYVRQAAGLASMHYWWAGQKEIYPFNWVVRHGSQGRKDQLITRTPDGPLADTFSPYGNMLVMQSRMKDNKVEATSDSLTEGQGVYAVASKDKSGASVMVWNYQHINNGRFRTTIDMSGLPSELGDGPVRQTLYRIDQTTSNYWTAPDKANLQQVGESIVTPQDSHSETVDLEPNAIYLILLEPVDRQ